MQKNTRTADFVGYFEKVPFALLMGYSANSTEHQADGAWWHYFPWNRYAVCPILQTYSFQCLFSNELP